MPKGLKERDREAVREWIRQSVLAEVSGTLRPSDKVLVGVREVAAYLRRLRPGHSNYWYYDRARDLLEEQWVKRPDVQQFPDGFRRRRLISADPAWIKGTMVSSARHGQQSVEEKRRQDISRMRREIGALGDRSRKNDAAFTNVSGGTDVRTPIKP